MKKITLNNAAIYFGTCSWKYDSWADTVYANLGSGNMLAEYARRYSSVEVDQWFWSLHSPTTVTLPRQKDVEEYAASVPDEFKFTIKAPNSLTLTHFYAKNKTEPLLANPHFLSEALLEKFLTSIEPLKDRTGLIMFQFEYLNQTKMPSQNHFLALLHSFAEKLPTNYSFGIEIRNPNYLNDQYFTFLKKHKLSPVFLQGYYMPPVFPLIKKQITRLHSPVVIRLHGPDRSGIEQKTKNVWNAIVEPKESELQELVAALVFLSNYENEIYVNVNNHYEGSAPLTIARIENNLKTENP